MNILRELREAIANELSNEKAYDLPEVCEKYGLEAGSQEETYASKRSYVLNRLKHKDQVFLVNLAQKISKDYGSVAIGKALGALLPDGGFKITNITRKKLLDELIFLDNISGKLELIDFLKRIWPLDQMPSTDGRFMNATGDIWQHMINNSDWSYQYLFETYLSLVHASDEQFSKFLEELVHPLVRDTDEQNHYVSLINKHLAVDGLRLEVRGHISGYPLYKVVEGNGINEKVKNLIFASNGSKPEIVLADSLSNNIQITKNAEHCLVYDSPITDTGLLWRHLVDWWGELTGENPAERDTEIKLYRRLRASLDSPPEIFFFETFFRKFRNNLGDSLPALIPQVYLHYDPYTIQQLKGKKRLPRQRMDFLILFSNYERVVIEIDGKQHYADGEIASPQKYAEMVAADRDLRLAGYEIYRFGGYELQGEAGKALAKDFFDKLFKKHKII